MSTKNTLNRDEVFEPSLAESKWRSQGWAIYKSPSSSTGSLATFINANSMSESEMSPPEDCQKDPSLELFSNNVSSSSLPSYNPPQPRRRTLSSTSRSQERFSMHELGSSNLIFSTNSNRYLSPTRHSVALDKGFDRNREWNLDRERIGNAGKGFGSLIDDDGEKESIAELIANVKDEDAFKLAQFTRMHAIQKNRNSPIPGVKSEKTGEQSGAPSPSDHGLRSSEVTLSKSEACKKYLEDKYREIFGIINNNEIYNPLCEVRARQASANLIGDDNDDMSLNDYDSDALLTEQVKKKFSSRRKKQCPWNISQIETRKSGNMAGQTLEKVEDVNNAIRDEVATSRIKVGNHAHDKNMRYNRRLSQIFIPPSPQEKDNLESPAGPGRNTKHSRASSLNSITHDDVFKAKSRGWSLHLFKRKDKKPQKRSSKGHQKPNVHNENKRVELSDGIQMSQNSLENLTDSSSNDQNPRSSAEFTRSSSEKEHGDSRETYEEKVKSDRGISKASDEKLLEKDDVPEGYSVHDRRSSLGASAAGLSDSSFESAKDAVTGNPKISVTASKSVVDSAGVEERLEKDSDEHHGPSTMQRSLSDDNRIIEINTEYEGDSEGDNELELLGETVLVKLDVLPDNLVRTVTSFQEQGLAPQNDEDNHYVELDIGLNDVFKFKKLVGHGADLVELRISLLGNKQKSIDLQDTEESIARYDESLKEATEFLEANQEIFLERKEVIRKNDRCFFDNFDIPFVQSPVFDGNFAHSQNVPSSDFVIHNETVYELKKRIDIGMEELNRSMTSMESTIEDLEN
ncbi:7432_t:CDS:2 [Acaulospora colombiana]|uniref:7432_t:CDS:1 n=1 Tax=Acaulospora colombiana TaxID=27376 RepID=A0ACA9K3T0_9GLOM|nr:7432_t:CDS:2 [Acaulospora colombiana]